MDRGKLFLKRYLKLNPSVCLITFICLALYLPAQAQTQQRGKLEIIKDPRIDSLIAHRYSKNKGTGKAIRSGISAYGYRVQFFSGPNRKAAFNAQNKFQQLHPELRTYINYKEPNFKVKGGDFRSRLEASKLVQELKGVFSPLYILSEKINLPKLDPNTTPQ
ncbi:SPOR domain-containing protein [Mucilaginibacter sp. PAMB04168]|uniref:SPOR domain-containing protein n=1 Tax=Mucilaginibacter sp. PAMB04168 TaxID=3138567 RepID=UPI0031F68302